MNKVFKLIISILIPLAVGGISGYFTTSNIGTWYAALNKPSWNPPNWIFGPVWTLLYIMMGIAFYIIWNERALEPSKRKAYAIYFVQLILNFFWSIIFFYFHQPGWALVEIILLWLAILITIFSFGRLNKTAAWLLVPYISWVSFAALLTYTIWQLNK